MNTGGRGAAAFTAEALQSQERDVGLRRPPLEIGDMQLNCPALEGVYLSEPKDIEKLLCSPSPHRLDILEWICISVYPPLQQQFSSLKESESDVKIKGYTCPRCKMVTLLEEEVRCLRAKRALQAPPGQPRSGQRVEGGATGGAAAETWRYVTHRRRSPARPPPSPGTNLELGNRFSPLGEAGADEASGDQQDPQPEMSGGKGAAAGEARARAWPPTSTRKVRQRVIVVGDSLLRGTEAVVCRPNLETREVCCLPGTRIWHVMDRVERLVHSRGHQPLLVIHVGTNDVARQGVAGITKDFEALGKKLRELKAQVAFSSILPVRGFGPGRDRRASKVNDWLRVWCQKERFGFLDHGTRFLANGLLARDGLNLTRMGKRSFGDALASFVRKTLN
ncbi:HAUS augmin-like complex subunit 7 [Varanus komodoensis]|nr:HAUS augmin-like complex subunit 7 [Varanus komodoensis]